MSRLFTFGCSFTNYRWSTWADCLAPEFDYFENWGQSGGGNQFHFNSIMEADQRHHFNNGDTVVVCWTDAMRDDRYVGHRWHTLGNVFNCPIYDSKYLKEYVEERGYLIRDLAYIKAVKVLLENRPGVTWQFLTMIEPNFGSRKKPDNSVVGTKSNTAGSVTAMMLATGLFGSIIEPNNVDNTQDNTQDVIRLYQDVIDSIAPSYYTVLFKETGWPDRNGDPHPTPEEHLAYLDAVLPGWVTKSETRAKIARETANLQKNRTGMSIVMRL